MSKTARITNEIIIPTSVAGREEDRRVIGGRSKARADRVVRHFSEHTAAFNSLEAFILCSGGYSAVENAEEAPTDSKEREANLVASYLISQGIPSRLVENTETESVTGVGSVGHLVADEFINPDLYNAERKLGVSLPPRYFGRYMLGLSKVGIDKESVDHLVSEDRESFLQEAVGYPLTRYALRHAATPQDLLDAEQWLLGLPIVGIHGNKPD